VSSGGAEKGEMWEAVTLTLLGKNKQILFDLLRDAKELALKEEIGYTLMYVANGSQWKAFGSARLQRPFESVVLEQG
jgi:chaperone BCS1